MADDMLRQDIYSPKPAPKPKTNRFNMADDALEKASSYQAPKPKTQSSTNRFDGAAQLRPNAPKKPFVKSPVPRVPNPGNPYKSNIPKFDFGTKKAVSKKPPPKLANSFDLTDFFSKIMVFPKEPDAIHWAKDFKSVEIAIEGEIREYDFRSSILTEKSRIPYPALKADEHIFGLWRDKQSENLRIASSLAIPSDQVIETDKGPVTKWINGELLPLFTDVEWGSHVVFQIYEWQENSHQWNLIAIEPSKWEAGDTPGASVLKDIWVEAGYSEDKLNADSYCNSMFQLFEGRLCFLLQDIEGLEQSFVETYYPNCPYEKLGMTSNECKFDMIGAEECADCTYSLFHPSLTGDNYYAASPFYLYENKRGGFKKIAIEGLKDFAQMTLKRIDSYVWLKRFSFDGDRIIVVDLNSGEITLDIEGTRPTWVGKYHKSSGF